jgi:hypothetical protein
MEEEFREEFARLGIRQGDYEEEEEEVEEEEEEEEKEEKENDAISNLKVLVCTDLS